MNGEVGGEAAGGRYATYWHRSTGGPIKDRSDIYGAADCAGRPSAAGTESRDIVGCAGKKAPPLSTTAEPETFSSTDRRVEAGCKGLIHSLSIKHGCGAK